MQIVLKSGQVTTMSYDLNPGSIDTFNEFNKILLSLGWHNTVPETDVEGPNGTTIVRNEHIPMKTLWKLTDPSLAVADFKKALTNINNNYAKVKGVVFAISNNEYQSYWNK